MANGQGWRRLGMLDVGVMLAGIGLLVYLQVTKDTDVETPEIPVAVFGEATTIATIAEVPADTEVQEAFATWSASPEYFGAFAADDEGHYGWTERYGGPEAAEIGAVAFCERRSSKCRLIARSLPEDFYETEAETLEADAARGFVEYQSKPGAKAYAHSQQGIAHWAWGHATVEDAERVALRNCTTRVENYAQDKPLPNWPCRLIRSEP